MFDFRQITLFCLEKRLSKHKIIKFSKNFGGLWPLWPPLATSMHGGALLPWSFAEENGSRSASFIFMNTIIGKPG